ncbi:MAG: DivIVA domain-containing protein [Candidatus Rokubacteria bacterium]|nr:DivIVA domain-containing protein [Candidatus Rokubacteria bacterium]
MRLSPLDIRQQQFTVRMLRGLDPAEVDAFLEDVADDYESLLKESALVREQLAGHEERLRNITEIETTLKDTLVTTQRLAEEMKESARREADDVRESAKREAELLRRDAELSGEKVLEEARAEAERMRAEIQTLKRMRRQLVEELRARLEMYQRMLAGDLAELPDDERKQP